MHCRQLLSLNVSTTEGRITDDSIKLVAMNCVQLQTLDVSHTNGRITDESIIAVAASCKSLRFLDLSFTDGMITDLSIVQIATSCAQLQFLDVSGPGAITLSSLELVVANCALLRSLFATGMRGRVTDEIVGRWLTIRRKLRVLYC